MLLMRVRVRTDKAKVANASGLVAFIPTFWNASYFGDPAEHILYFEFPVLGCPIGISCDPCFTIFVPMHSQNIIGK
jgi:hypothetical protein